MLDIRVERGGATIDNASIHSTTAVAWSSWAVNLRARNFGTHEKLGVRALSVSRHFPYLPPIHVPVPLYTSDPFKMRKEKVIHIYSYVGFPKLRASIWYVHTLHAYPHIRIPITYRTMCIPPSRMYVLMVS
jgi:hypothetical protein